MIGETGMVENFDVSLCLSFIRKKTFLQVLMKLEQSETSKFSTIPVSPIMSLFNQFSTRLGNLQAVVRGAPLGCLAESLGWVGMV